MTQMIDTEGCEIPKDSCSGATLFFADLCDWGDGKGPDLSINVPMYFEEDSGVYDSGGVVTAPIQDILEEYLSEFKKIDGGEHVDKFSAWLKDYADRLLAAK